MLAIILGELLLLYFLSRSLKLGLYRVIFLVTKSRRVPISILALLFFPGTVIHELAHWIVAETLRVPTGDITLYPVIEHSGQVRMGSVEIARVDPIRRSLVGLAPIVVGLILLLASTSWYFGEIPREISGIRGTSGEMSIYLYSLFTIGNMMFSSRRDLEGLWALLILIILISSGVFVLNLTALIPQAFFAKSEMFAQLLSTPLAILVGIDILLLGFIHVSMYLTQKVLRRRLG